MPSLVYAVPCVTAINDRETNLMSYISVVEGVELHEVPTKLDAGLVIGTSWIGSDSKDRLCAKLIVCDPDGKPLAERELKIRDFAEYRRVRLNITVPAFDVAKTGTYSLVIATKPDPESDEWTQVNSLPLDVTVAEKNQ